MRTFLSSLGLLFLTLSAFSQQVAKSLNLNGATVGFYEFKPYDYNQNPSKTYPLIIFLHGIGERGNGTTELPYVASIGLPAYIKMGAPMTYTVNGETESFMVLSPQLPKWMGYWDPSFIDAMLDYAEKNLRVNKDRIFLTGLSLGGGGVWGYASSSLANAKKFAAIAPVCGVCYYDLNELPSTIAKADIGVWGFANLDDNIVSPWCTISAMDVLEKHNKKPGKIKKTINAWGGHDAWTKAYDPAHNYQTPNLYEWFLEQAQEKSGIGSGGGSGSSNSQYPAPNIAPVAKAGNDVSITLPTNTVTLNNAGSYDSDGNITGFNWSLVSGPSQASLASANAASTRVNNLVAGTYVFRLTVTDNGGATATSDLKVYVNLAPNVAPVAKAGNDVSINLPTNSATLNNSGSYDSDGSIVSYRWSVLSGPSQPSIASPTAASSVVNNLTVGTYVFRLTVTDNDGATATSDMKVTVGKAPNYSPVAKVGNDVTVTLPTSTATISNSGSYDGDGSIDDWSWTLVSGPSQATIASRNAASTQVSNLRAGTYVFRLTVTDNDGASASADIKVLVNPKANVAPVAKAGNGANITLPTNSVSISNAGSYDSDGNIENFKWSLVSGPSQPTIASPNAASTQIYNLIAGTFVFRLTVTDDDGATAYADVTVTVNAAKNVSPVAKVGSDINITLPANSATLNNAGSYDADGSISSWKWSVVSGPSTPTLASPNNASTQVSNLEAGAYVFRLTITDNDDASSSADVKVIVNPAVVSNQPPVANAGDDVTFQSSHYGFMNGSKSKASQGARLVRYTWTLVSGPNQYYLLTPNEKGTFIKHAVPGSYIFRLTVVDNNGNSDADDVAVTVTGTATPPTPSTPSEAEAPIVNAGKDFTVIYPYSGVLDGTKSKASGNAKITNYSWTKISGPAQYNIVTPLSNGSWINSLVIGTYTFRLTVLDNNGMTAYDDVVVTVKPLNSNTTSNGQDLTAIETQENVITTEKVKIYPNPVQSMLNVNWTGDIKGNATLKVVDATGRVIKTVPVKKEQTIFNTSIEVGSLVPGIYFIQVQLQNRKTILHQFLKN